MALNSYVIALNGGFKSKTWHQGLTRRLRPSIVWDAPKMFVVGYQGWSEEVRKTTVMTKSTYPKATSFYG